MMNICYERDDRPFKFPEHIDFKPNPIDPVKSGYQLLQDDEATTKKLLQLNRKMLESKIEELHILHSLNESNDPSQLEFINSRISNVRQQIHENKQTIQNLKKDLIDIAKERSVWIFTPSPEQG